jgi:hypothetical protein
MTLRKDKRCRRVEVCFDGRVDGRIAGKLDTLPFHKRRH